MIGQEVNKQVSAGLVEKNGTIRNPFPGLRPFLFEESHLFYGQDTICDQVILKLLANKFVCLLGGAGTGKTSLINCGIKPFVLSGLLSGPDTTWHIFQTQPGNDPMRNLAHVVYSQKFFECFEENQRLQEQICLSIIQRGRQGLVELISQLNLSGDHKFLFIIDQFEDLFRLKSKVNEAAFYDEAVQYVDLFVETLRSVRLQAYVVISIRSDFTDDFVVFPALAEYINRSNVIIPKMSRQQIQETIMGPLRALNVTMDDSLIAQILNESSSVEDMLPRLQHSLQRTWGSWASLDNWEKPIALKEYDSIGGIKNSISIHANSIYDTLSEGDRKLCEIIFKALTERGSENKGLSRPTTINALSEIARVEVNEIIKVLDAFNQPGAVFLSFSDENLQSSTIVDLSHVSLMRAWNKLKEWVEDEAISSQMYRKLSNEAAAYQVGKTGLLKSPDLQFAINWKEKQNPNLHWAKRYNPAFERTMVFLRTSLESYEAEEALKRKKAKRAIRRIRSLSLVLGSTAILALVLTIYSQILKRDADKKTMWAIEQTSQSEAKAEKLEKLNKEALEKTWKAEQAANESEKMRLMALEQNKSLAEQKFIAETTAEQALRKTEETEKTLVQISRQKEQIEQSAIEAGIQKSLAEKEKEEAFKKRMLTISQSLAVKAQQISGNGNLKAALALHAFQFNYLFGGADFNPDIYYALSGALTGLGQNVRVSMKGHAGSVKAMVTRGNTMYTTGGDGSVFAWNMIEVNATPKLLWRNPVGNVSLAVHPNGRYLAVGSDNGAIQMIDLTNTDAAPVKLKGHQGIVFSLAFSRDGLLYSSGSDKTIMVWNLTSGSGTSVFPVTSNARAISVSPDGRLLVCGTDEGKIFVWDIRGEELSSMINDDAPIYSLAFNNSGNLVVTGDVKGGIKLWNPNTSRFIARLRGHSARVVDITFSPHGDLMASSSYDGTTNIFDFRNLNSQPMVLKEPGSWILSASFNSDGKRIFLATNKADFLVSYPAKTIVMADLACGKTIKGLSADEWNTFIGSDIKYQKPCE